MTAATSAYLRPALRAHGAFAPASATTLAVRDLGPVQVLRVAAPRPTDSPAAGYADPGDALVWGYSTAGAIITTTDRGEDTLCDTGELLINHMQRLSGFRMTATYRALSIRIPTGDLALRPRDVDRVSSHTAASSSLLPRLIGTLASHVIADVSDASPATDAVIARSLTDLAIAHADAILGRATPPEVRARELVARAGEFITRYASFRSVTPQTVADHLGIPLRTLQKVFESDGTTVRDEIRTARLRHARRLLEQNERVRVETVAERTGFGSASAFSRAFAAEYGMSPRDWRASRAET